MSYSFQFKSIQRHSSVFDNCMLFCASNQMRTSGWPSGSCHGETTLRAPVIVTVLLHRNTHQLRQERLGEATDGRMPWHHGRKRAAIAADTGMTVTCFKFSHPAEFIKDLDSRSKSYTQ